MSKVKYDITVSVLVSSGSTQTTIDYTFEGVESYGSNTHGYYYIYETTKPLVKWVFPIDKSIMHVTEVEGNG